MDGYVASIVVHRTYQQGQFFRLHGPIQENAFIAMTDPTAQKPWMVLACNVLADLHLVGAAAGAVCVARHRFSDGEQFDNITDWALDQFRTHYGATSGEISKEGIFHYVYGVLHDPIYREKYAQNLKREYPRVPLYPDFRCWADWGEKLMALHIGYNSATPWPLKRTNVKDESAARADLAPKAMLKADTIHGIIVLDSETQLSGIPAVAWEYRLGNRSGLEWILDQYKEKTPKDRTIREKFNTYRFAHYKETVIDLLARVTRVSVETMQIIAAMKALER